MSSILTNNSAMAALQNLGNTQKDLAKTQSQISSGLKVATASDNAAYWSISQSMKSDVSALGAVTNALNLGASVLNAATSAMGGIETILKQMKADIVTAQTTGANLTQVQSDITAQQQSLKSIISSASFNGVNLLDGSSATAGVGDVKFVSAFSRDSSGSTSIGTISLDVGSTGTLLSGKDGFLGSAIALTTTDSSGATVTLTTDSQGTADGTAGTPGGDYTKDSILGFSLSANTTDEDITILSNAINAAITSVTAAGAKLGSAKTTVDTQLAFTSSLSDAITSGVGSLEDADMNIASTRLQALQTQQQLGIQSLSIANQNSQLILKLFGS